MSTETKPKISIMAKLSSIIAIIIAIAFVIAIFFWTSVSIFFMPLYFLFIPYIFLFCYNLKFLRTGKSFVGAGVWGLFVFIIPGILILALGRDKSIQTIEINPTEEIYQQQEIHQHRHYHQYQI